MPSVSKKRAEPICAPSPIVRKKPAATKRTERSNKDTSQVFSDKIDKTDETQKPEGVQRTCDSNGNLVMLKYSRTLRDNTHKKLQEGVPDSSFTPEELDCRDRCFPHSPRFTGEQDEHPASQ